MWGGAGRTPTTTTTMLPKTELFPQQTRKQLACLPDAEAAPAPARLQDAVCETKLRESMTEQTEAGEAAAARNRWSRLSCLPHDVGLVVLL